MTENPPSGRARSNLGLELDQATRHDRRRALRALLRQPLLTADGPGAAEFGLVRHHAAWLREWLARNPGWSLQLDSEVARLRKTPAELGDGTRPAREPKSRTPFNRRRYVLFCLALAALERSDRQTTLGRLAEAVVSAVAADPALAASGISFDLMTPEQRRDLISVVRLLLELRVLVRVHGDEQQYLHQRGDVLYNVNRPALAALLNVKRGPSTIAATGWDERLALLTEEPLPVSDEGRHRRLRSALTRRLLDDPVLYYDELTAEERAYLNSQRSLILREIREATGLVAEVRQEGIALIDERGDLSDLSLPEEGTEGHLTLLLAEYLAAAVRTPGSSHSARTVSLAALHQHTAELIARHLQHWRKDVAAPGAEVALCGQILERLAALGLLRLTPDGVVPRPAIARYALAEPSHDGDGADRELALDLEPEA